MRDLQPEKDCRLPGDLTNVRVIALCINGELVVA